MAAPAARKPVRVGLTRTPGRLTALTCHCSCCRSFLRSFYWARPGLPFLRFTATHRTRSRVTLTIMAAAADSALCSDMLHPLPALLCPATCSLLFPSPFPACSPSPLRLSACLLHLRFPLQRERFGYQSAHPPHRPTTCLPASSYQFAFLQASIAQKCSRAPIPHFASRPTVALDGRGRA